MTRTYRVTMQYPDGSTMFIGTMLAEEIDGAPVAPKPQVNGPVQSGSDVKMTDPQKRYLFRLLGAQGITGKAAEDHLKKYFQMGFVKDIPKQAASEYINQLTKDRKEAGDGRT